MNAQVEVSEVMKEPHPFVNAKIMNNFVGKTVAIVGKIDKPVEGNQFVLRSSDDKEVSV
eukprot:CAMPEP_0116886122 /NCGR_PEP_ID=MMETSP0463-20121206/19807_1 /TAXON_ID=181622 /ORGANISM="Strombidinopsis sp, Strain SopsisLIS2011" /LENGTH=58 /DNA_ID=CAMNT_0004545897 /DNA_START=16 /DNA_END=192 /DNA_ORIENTATION=-